LVRFATTFGAQRNFQWSCEFDFAKKLVYCVKMFQDRDTGFSQAASDDISYVRETDTETVVTSSAARIADAINPGVDSRDFSTWRLREAAPNAVDSSLSRHAVAPAARGDSARAVDLPTGVTESPVLRQSHRVSRHLHNPSRQLQPSGATGTVSCGSGNYDVCYESGDDAVNYLTQRSLERQIRQLQSKIKLLSTARKSRVRAEIAASLHDDSSGSSSSMASGVFHSADTNQPRSASHRGSKGQSRPSRARSARQGNGSTLEVRRSSRLGDGDLAVSAAGCPATTDPEETRATSSGRTPGGVAPGVTQATAGEAAVSNTAVESQTSIPRKPLKLDKFDGTSVPLETFLAKLENVSRYNNWCEADRVVFLRDALTGNASQILWELKPDASSQEIINLMRVRFGNTHNTERFRAELYSRRRGVGESIPAVYQDIRRLLALAFPGQAGEMYESVGKEAFLSALNDPALRIRVLDKEPKTLDETLTVVTRMDAYSNQHMNPAQGDETTEKKRVRLVSPARESEADRRIKSLEEFVERQNEEIKKLKQQRLSNSRANFGRKSSEFVSGGWQQQPQPQVPRVDSVFVPTDNYLDSGVDGNYVPYCPSNVGPELAANQYVGPRYVNSSPVSSQPSLSGQSGAQCSAPRHYMQQPAQGNYVPYSPTREFRPRNRGRNLHKRAPIGSRLPYDTCARCGGKGHWKSQCPVVGYTFDQNGPPSQGTPPWKPDLQSAGNVKLMSSNGKTETYVDVTIRGRTIQGLLDTGSELNVCPFRFCKNAKITPVQTELFAANSTPISVIGITRLHFEVGGVPSHADMLVSEEVDEFLLGFSYLKENNCEWLFAQSRILINGHPVPLRSRPSKGALRRIYVREPVVIPADAAVNVPIRLPFHSLNVPESNWVTEAKQIKPGLLVARTLLPHDSNFAAVALLNMSGVDQSLKSGHQLGVALACPPELIRDFESTLDSSLNSFSRVHDGTTVDAGNCNRPSARNHLNCDAAAAKQARALCESVVGDCGADESKFIDGTSIVESVSVVDGCHLAANVGPLTSSGAAQTAAVAGTSDVTGATGLATDGRASVDVACQAAAAGQVQAAELAASEKAVNELASATEADRYDILVSAELDVDSCRESNMLHEQTSSGNNFVVDGDIDTVVKSCVNVIYTTASDTLHVQPVIDKLPETLTPEQREQAVDLIRRNADIFSKHEFDVGYTDLLTASIETGNHPPIAEPLRRHARAHLDIIDETVEKMEAAGIVERASSPWSFNLVVVSRYDDHGKPTTPRITIDYRRLNAITYKDKHPIPHIKDCLQSLGNVSWLSSVDISNSFYQIGLREQDKDKTAFVTRKGQFRLTRLGQGQTNSPAIFARLMNMVLRGLSCCLAFIDDTLVFSATFEQHLVDLQKLFDRFRAAKLKLKPTKAKLFQNECDFVGHHVSSSGLSVQQKKVACIQNWPFPKNISELRAYLGLCSYYRSYCPNFATIAEPLTECLRRGVPLEPTERRQKAFDRLKQMLSSAPVLAVPRDDPNCQYVIDTDASNFAASGICQQWQDGKLRVIEYASRVFNQAERNYCATRREMAAVIFALRQFRPYLLGRKFLIRVDNQALSFFMRLRNPTGQAARYLDFLADYDFEISHRGSAQNRNADGVSRIPPCSLKNGEPCDQCVKRVIGQHAVNAVTTRARSRQEVIAAGEATSPNSPEVPNDSVRHDAVNGANESTIECGSNKRRRRRKTRRGPSLQAIAPQAWESTALGWSNESIRQSQLSDPNIGPAIRWVEARQRPPWLEVESKSPMLRALWVQFDSLGVFEGILYRSFYDSNGQVEHYQLVLPRELRIPFLELIHNDLSGHLKQAKCVPHIMRRAWWYGWRGDLKLFIKCCSKCESFHRGKPPRQANLKPTFSGAPGEKLALDLQGPFPSSNGYKYILTVLCLFSKFGICLPLRNKEASTVAKALIEHVFLKYGLCHTLLTDLGKEFQCELLDELTNVLGVTKLRTSGYRPQANGACEVWHRLINAMFAKCVRADQKDWSDWLSYVTFCYNAAEHSATKFSPFFIFTGRSPIWTIDLALPQVGEASKTVPEYVTKVTRKLERVNDLVRENLAVGWQQSSKWYNKKTHVKTFQPGEAVRVYYPRTYKGKTPKWERFYRTEAVIEKKLNDSTYLVKSKSWKTGKIIHVDKIKPIVQFQ